MFFVPEYAANNVLFPECAANHVFFSQECPTNYIYFPECAVNHVFSQNVL